MPLEKEIIHKELDLVQAIITRMASNSFSVKAWLIGVLGAMITLSKDSLFISCPCRIAQPLLISISLLLPVLCFWYLDAFFLSKEKLYRGLYQWLVKYRPLTSDYLYDLNTFTRTVNGQQENLINPGNFIARVMWSATLRPFYLIPLALVLIIICYNVGQIAYALAGV